MKNSTETRTCLRCESPTKDSRRKYCSPKCYHESRYIKDVSKMSIRTLMRRRKKDGLSKFCPRYSLNESFFLQWSSDLCWLLGLIWSDGCLHRRRNAVSITSKDHEMLETVKSLISFTGPIKKKHKVEVFEIEFSSKSMCNRLRQLGLVPAKSLVATYPPIPEAYEADFFRGMMDGDGWVSLTMNRPGQQAADLHVGVCGAAPELGEGLSKSLTRLGVGHIFKWVDKKPYKPQWKVIVERHRDLKILHSIIYAPNKPALSRKKTNFDEWIKTPRHRSGRKVSTSISFDGRTMSLTEWSRETGIKYNTLGNRISRGWSADMALTTTPSKTNKYLTT